MISAMRNQLIEDLKEIPDVQVSTTFDRVNVPAIIVRPANSGSYVDYPAEQRFKRAYRVHMDVWVAVRNGGSELEALETLIEQVLYNADDWALDGVDPIGLLNIQNADYPGVLIRLSKIDSIEE